MGTRRADTLRGTRGRDVIAGQGGDDRIFGLGGNDLICGSGGSDYVSPGGGGDRVTAGGGHDTLAASPGKDRLIGGPGSDWLDFRDSPRAVVVSLARGRIAKVRFASMENIVGSRRADTISGDAGMNQLRGGAGDDVLNGLDGNDTLVGQTGNDTLDGGEGTLDFVAHPTAPGPVTADLGAGTVSGEGSDRLIGVEGVAGSRHADTLYGGGAAAVLAGGPGNDTIIGSGESDFLLSLTSGARVDLGGQAATSEGTDSVTGIEVVIGTSGNDVITGSDADEVFVAGAGNDTVSGGGGSDILSGGEGSDALMGGAGDDVLLGDETTGTADQLDGGDGADVADYGNSSTAVSVNLLSGSGPSGDTLSTIEMVAGSAGADTIVGNDSNNTLMGGPGDDTISGAGGNDVAAGGAGADLLAGDGGDDYLTGDDGGGSADGGTGSDVCVDLTPATGCEATQFTGGQAPNAKVRSTISPRSAAATATAQRAPTNSRVPYSDWFGQGNPHVSCNDGLDTTRSVISAFLPARVRPDYASANQQTVWVRHEIFDLFNPNAPLQYSNWYYTVLNSDQWSSNYWYLSQGLGNDPVNAWSTTFARNYALNYAVVYDVWWQDNWTGQFIYHDRWRAWHQTGNGFYSDRCAAQALGYFNGSPTTGTVPCATNWTESYCATYRAFFSSFQTPFIYPSTTFRGRERG